MQPHARHAAAEPHGDADGDAQPDNNVDTESERDALQSDAVRADGDPAGDGDGGAAAYADPDGVGEQHAVVERGGVPDACCDDDGGWWESDAERHSRRWERRPDMAGGGAAATVSLGTRPAARHAPELCAGVDGAAERVWWSVGSDAEQRDVGAQRDESVHRPGAGCARAPRLLHCCRRDDSHSLRRCGGVRRLQGCAAWVLYDQVEHAARCCQRPLGDHRRRCGCDGCCRGGDRRAGLHSGDAGARRFREDAMRLGAGACEHRCAAVLPVGVRCPRPAVDGSGQRAARRCVRVRALRCDGGLPAVARRGRGECVGGNALPEPDVRRGPRDAARHLLWLRARTGDARRPRAAPRGWRRWCAVRCSVPCWRVLLDCPPRGRELHEVLAVFEEAAARAPAVPRRVLVSRGAAADVRRHADEHEGQPRVLVRVPAVGAVCGVPDCGCAPVRGRLPRPVLLHGCCAACGRGRGCLHEHDALGLPDGDARGELCAPCGAVRDQRGEPPCAERRRCEGVRGYRAAADDCAACGRCVQRRCVVRGGPPLAGAARAAAWRAGGAATR
ncbi:hypothetical protein ECC02_008573 [Trypanosoma cruzi]|uniref:Amastigote surface protein n=1 Tax=Trypanosoma cruzi TaxID=5693 RepID=A0A7J6XWD1_TRYCR|nr:hypothetical protein ECC02_008573 [Trypanosoma cruzi]